MFPVCLVVFGVEYLFLGKGLAEMGIPVDRLDERDDFLRQLAHFFPVL